MKQKQRVIAAQTQSRRLKVRGQSPDDFKSVARRLGSDESEAAFDKALGKIARAKLAPKKKKKPHK